MQLGAAYVGVYTYVAMPDESERVEIARLLHELGSDPEATASRIAVCEVIAAALARLGQLLWLAGAISGTDRKTGVSPFSFGDDRTVGVATVAQIGAELAAGAITLLKADNLYAANALIRQIVEVEYLADVFEAQDGIAADWLRADRQQRLDFWSPGRLRQRAGGRFLSTDYWRHCEIGGHPATPGMQLLPGHRRPNAAYFWADMAGHLSGIWHSLAEMMQQLSEPIPPEIGIPDVDAAIHRWHSADGLYAALGDLSQILREDSEALSSDDAAGA